MYREAAIDEQIYNAVHLVAKWDWHKMHFIFVALIPLNLSILVVVTAASASWQTGFAAASFAVGLESLLASIVVVCDKVCD
jgi:hypothetical protein